MKTGIVLSLSLLVLGSSAAFAQRTELGSIDFDTSGSSAAQPHFIEGVKALHSFQWTEAAISFRKAKEIDPTFAMAYWGEAMSHNHPLWAQQDMGAAKGILESLSPTLSGRLQLAPMEKEKAWLSTIDVLYYTPGDKLTRDIAYSDAMADMYERWPDDDEVATFYALSLLGTVRPGDRGFRRQAQAASIAMPIFERNPDHPGAAHFTIHSFDDPDHAILALPHALAYAEVAPMAAHALHMPSHIFLQLGMWERVVNSNIDAYASAMRVVNELGAAEGGEDFHTLSWLAYGYLMLGETARAEQQLGHAKDAVDRNPRNPRVMNGYLQMRARHILESGATPEIALAPAGEAEGDNDSWVSMVGMVAARRGDIDTARSAANRITAMREAIGGDGTSFAEQRLATLENEIRALALASQGRFEAAIEHSQSAVNSELAVGAPSGPPNPIKPALELHAEILLQAGRADEAVDAYQRSLQWIPQRPASLIGLARAAQQAGQQQLARQTYQALVDMPGANLSSDLFAEAHAAL